MCDFKLVSSGHFFFFLESVFGGGGVEDSMLGSVDFYSFGESTLPQ